MKNIALAALASTALATTALAGFAAPAAATTFKPVSGAEAVHFLGAVNLRDLAASTSNNAAIGNLHSARPVAPLPLLLPDGKPETGRGINPATLQHLRSNTTLAGPPLSSIGGFTGIYEGSNAAANGSELEPPDQGLSVANNVVGEIVNNTIQFFRSGQPLTNPVANYIFFGSGTVANLSDPHITYDPSVQRWFADELTYSGPLGYGIYVAVSFSSDPLGSWNVYFVPAGANDTKGCKPSGCLPDYPQVGYDTAAYYVDTDLFGNKGFVAAQILALPKQLLISGKSFTPVRFLVQDFVVQPVVPAPGEPFSLANGGTEFFLTARNIFDGSTNIRVYQLQNTLNIVTNPSSLTLVSNDLAAESYTSTVPSQQPNIIGPLGRSVHATAAPMLDGGYNAFSANVKLAAGKLWGALTTGTTDSKGLARDVIAWFSVDVSGATPTLKKQGYIVPPDGYSISYPGLALNRGGNGYVGFTITNPDKNVAGGFPSTAVAPFTHGTVGSITVTGQGGATDDGFTAYAAFGGSGVGRWGDYASAVVDPNTGIFYTANEFIPDPNVYPRGVFANWGTFVTAIRNR